MIELKGPTTTTIENIKTENSKMDESDVMIEERRNKTQTVTPDAQAPMISQKMEIEIVSQKNEYEQRKQLKVIESQISKNDIKNSQSSRAAPSLHTRFPHH